MGYTKKETHDLLDEIFEWEREHPGKLDMNFPESVNEFFEKHGYITEKQTKALYNIYRAFHMGN